MTRSNLGTIIAFPYNVPMPYQVDPITGKLVQAPSLLQVPGQGQGAGGGACEACNHSVHFPPDHQHFRRLRKFNCGLRGLGQDMSLDSLDSSGDGGGGFDMSGGGGGSFAPLDSGISGGGGGFDTGSSSPVDVQTIPSSTLPFIDTTAPVPSSSVDVQNLPASSLPFVDATSGLPAGSTINMSNGDVTLPDGSLIDGGTGTIYMSNGTVYYPDGSQQLPDGSFIDANGNYYPPGGAASAAASRAVQSSGGGSPSGGPGGSRGSGSGTGSGSSLQQLICAINPSASGCGGTAKPAGTGSSGPGANVSSWFSQNWTWIAGLGAVLFVLPALLPSGRR